MLTGRVTVLRSTQVQAVLNCKFRESRGTDQPAEVQFSFFLPE